MILKMNAAWKQPLCRENLCERFPLNPPPFLGEKDCIVCNYINNLGWINSRGKRHQYNKRCINISLVERKTL